MNKAKNRNKQTKFPVARIKKIMQKDEEVGKVAQATPVVISKALELFLAMLVEEAANVTLQRNSKRVEPYHLKHAIDHTDMLDFLKEIVDGVPDPSAGGTIDLEAEKEARRKQAKQAYRKRKKKGAAEGEIGAEGDGEVEGMEEDDIGPEPETAGGAGSSEWAAVDYAADEDYSDRDWD